MKRLGRIAICLAVGLALNAGLRAASPVPAKHPPSARVPDSANNPSPDNPYAAIAARNIFGLVAPPPPPDPNAHIEDSLPKITPEGIMGVFGNYQVLFKVGPAKPGAGAKDEFYTLSEGQRQDDIEVVKIDNEKSLVTFDNHGITQELPLTDAPTSGTSAPSSPGGMNPGMAPGSPGVAANSINDAGGITRFGVGPAENNGGMPNGKPGSNGGGGPNSVNNGMNFGNAVAPTQIYQPEPSTMSREDIEILLAAQHLKAIQENSPTAPLFPPSAIDSQTGIPNNTDSGNNAAPAP